VSNIKVKMKSVDIYKPITNIACIRSMSLSVISILLIMRQYWVFLTLKRSSGQLLIKLDGSMMSGTSRIKQASFLWIKIM